MSITLEEFTRRIADAVNGAPELSGVWVTAETSDVRRSGHCYLELVQKHPLTGEPVAKLRATIWRNALAQIDRAFQAATGERLASGMKVMVRVTASFHAAYGLSANITEIDPSYTLGDLMRRRLEILEQLKKDGILELNRQLEWPEVALRIAVISAPGAAGYGDFIHQLFTSPYRLDFKVQLFPAVMQGASTVPTVISALDRIAEHEDEWDCVVIIRGGGATTDLAAFDSYELASNIAQFPLPVIIGIGHERDVTVLDYVANMRVKTPTAAAEWLIGRGSEILARLDRLANDVYRLASDMLAGSREQLARIGAMLPGLPYAALHSARMNLDRMAMSVSDTALGCIRPRLARLDVMDERLRTAAAGVIERQLNRLERIESLVNVLSPQATLARGYSITRVGGHAVTSVSQLLPGTIIHTTLPDGSVCSTVNGMSE